MKRLSLQVVSSLSLVVINQKLVEGGIIKMTPSDNLHLVVISLQSTFVLGVLVVVCVASHLLWPHVIFLQNLSISPL